MPCVYVGVWIRFQAQKEERRKRKWRQMTDENEDS
jgi:hypothetical protein